MTNVEIEDPISYLMSTNDQGRTDTVIVDHGHNTDFRCSTTMNSVVQDLLTSTKLLYYVHFAFRVSESTGEDLKT